MMKVIKLSSDELNSLFDKLTDEGKEELKKVIPADVLETLKNSENAQASFRRAYENLKDFIECYDENHPVHTMAAHAISNVLNRIHRLAMPYVESIEKGDSVCGKYIAQYTLQAIKDEVNDLECAIKEHGECGCSKRRGKAH